MNKRVLILSFLVLFLGSRSLVLASTFGPQNLMSLEPMPSWLNLENYIDSYSGPNDQSMKSFSSILSFSGALDSVDIFYQFIYLRDDYLSDTRYSSGISWDNYPATGYVDYHKYTPVYLIVFGPTGIITYEVVSYSVTLTPGNPGSVTVDANVGYHWDPYYGSPGGYVGSDNQFVGEYYVYARANAAPVPEPATMLLFGSGLVSLAGFRKRFKRA